MLTEKISRKKFFKILGYFLLLPFGFFSYSALSGKSGINKRSIKKFKFTSLPKGISFREDLIVVNESQLKIFSARCSHLGCLISNYRNGLLICACHGSKFDADGIPVEGPASKPLKAVNYEIKKDSNELIVYGMEKI